MGRRNGTHNERRRGNQLGLSCFLHAESANFSISQTASGRPRFSQTFFWVCKKQSHLFLALSFEIIKIFSAAPTVNQAEKLPLGRYTGNVLKKC